MLKNIETDITDRLVKFVEYDTTKNWIADFPKENWCLIIITEEYKPKYFDEIIRKSIDRNVAYICGVGPQSNELHSLADEIIAIRESEFEDNYLPNHVIMTTEDEDFDNGIWYGLNLTFNSETDINEIVILDVTKKSFKRTIDLIDKFNNGYLPPD